MGQRYTNFKYAESEEIPAFETQRTMFAQKQEEKLTILAMNKYAIFAVINYA